MADNPCLSHRVTGILKADDPWVHDVKGCASVRRVHNLMAGDEKNIHREMEGSQEREFGFTFMKTVALFHFLLDFLFKDNADLTSVFHVTVSS